MKENVEIDINGETIRGVLEGKNKDKFMILVHGFTGDMRGPDNIFGKLSEKLQENGISALRFSFRGTPPSDGDFQDMTVESESEDLKKIIEYAKSQGFERIGVLGESMGGTIVSAVHDPGLRVIVFWYPAFELIDTDLKKYLTEKSQKVLSEKGFVLDSGFKIGKKFIGEINKINLYDKIKDLKCPVLFLHGNNDVEVPYQQSEKAFELANEPKEIQIIDGADHCFRNEQEEVIDKTLDFLKRHF